MNAARRLGEDHNLYMQALAADARYKVIRHYGYGAIVRSDSLSGRHNTEDLYRAGCRLSAGATEILRKQEKHIYAKFKPPHFLHAKNRRT